jgi:hypothetical protein
MAFWIVCRMPACCDGRGIPNENADHLRFPLTMLKPLWSFLRFSAAQRKAVTEAILFSGAARLCLLFVPFKRLHRFLGKVGFESHRDPVEVERAPDVRMVKKAVEITARRVPWRCLCFEQAITANWMLKRRGIGGTIYLGVRAKNQTGIDAHAWLRVGPVWLTGGGGKVESQFHAISAFAWKAREPSASLAEWQPTPQNDSASL